jgi:hypothetical protein
MVIEMHRTLVLGIPGHPLTSVQTRYLTTTKPICGKA